MTFWAKVNKTEDCWLWTGNTRHGYGVYWNSNRRNAAHRWSYDWRRNEDRRTRERSIARGEALR